MIKPTDFTQVASSVTGLIGTTGGVLISYLTLRHTFRKDQPQIKIDVGVANLVTPAMPGEKANVSEEMLTFKVANVGSREYVVVQIGFALGKHSGGVVISNPNGTVKLPYNLKPYETCNFWTEYKNVVSSAKKNKPRLYNHIKIRGYVKDYVGNAFDSDWITIVIRETKFRKATTKLNNRWHELIRVIIP